MALTRRLSLLVDMYATAKPTSKSQGKESHSDSNIFLVARYLVTLHEVGLSQTNSPL